MKPSTPRKLAYFSSEYPCVSHTFIRREIKGLEAREFEVTRIGIQAGSALVDPEDLDELKKTRLIKNKKTEIMRNVLAGFITVGLRNTLRGVARAIRLGKQSHRGVTRHMLYFLEALVLIKHMRDARVNHVHVHFANNAATIALIANAMNALTYSMMVHGPLEFDAPQSESLGEKVECAEFTTAITHYCAAQIRRWASYSAWQKIHIIKCTIDGAWIDAAVPVEPGCHDIVCVGRLGNEKGQALLVDAFAEAVAHGFTGKLILVGDGDMRGVIESRVTQHDLVERVVLRGWLTGNEIREELKNCRALVLPSFAEGLPVVIMEAMASMRPIITTWITGIPELVEQNKHGWLFAPGDQPALVNALLELEQKSLNDLHAMGQQAQHKVAEHHLVDGQVAKLADLLDALNAKTA